MNIKVEFETLMNMETPLNGSNVLILVSNLIHYNNERIDPAEENPKESMLNLIENVKSGKENILVLLIAIQLDLFVSILTEIFYQNIVEMFDIWRNGKTRIFLVWRKNHTKTRVSNIIEESTIL